MTLRPVDLTFRQPNVPPSVNDTKGRHWGAVRDRLDPWKYGAYATAHNHRVRAVRLQRVPLWRPKPIAVTAVLQFRTTRGRDPHNYTGTVVKAIVDGLVMAKIVPGDTPEWVTVMDPVLETVPANVTPTCTIRIRPREVFTHGTK